MRVAGTLVAGVIAVIGQSACTPERDGGCGGHGDCAAGQVCLEATCYEVCSVQRHCDADQVCLDEVCRKRQEGAGPRIKAVGGNGEEVTQIRDGLIVEGLELGDAVFELRSEGEALALETRHQQDDLVTVGLPPDVRSGRYTLVAINLAGEDEAPVQLMLPDITGTLIVDKLNAAETQGIISNERLDVGPNPGQIAKGDHHHDDRYYTSDDADTKFVDASGDTISGALEVEGALTTSETITTLGELGVGVSEPTQPLQVAPKGFDYALNATDLTGHTENMPRCECDTTEGGADCGDGFSTKTYQKPVCYDWWQVDGAPEDKRSRSYTTSDVPALSVTEDGRMGVNTLAPKGTRHLAVGGDARFGNFEMARRAFRTGWSRQKEIEHYVLLAKVASNDKMMGRFFGYRGGDGSIPRGFTAEVVIDLSASYDDVWEFTSASDRAQGKLKLVRVNYKGDDWIGFRFETGNTIHSNNVSFLGFSDVHRDAFTVVAADDDDISEQSCKSPGGGTCN